MDWKGLVKKAARRPVQVFHKLFFSLYYLYYRLGQGRFRLQPLEELEGKRILLLVPHVDDEVIGCGGLLVSLREKSGSVKCLYLTDGAGSYNPQLGREELARRRMEEGRRVSASLGLEPPGFLGLEDGKLSLSPGAVAMVREELRRFRPELVFLSSPLEGHRDHTVAAGLGLAALEEEGYPEHFPLCLYAVNSPLTPYAANRYLPLEKELLLKEEALKIFQTQTMPFEGLLVLDRARRWALPPEVRKKARGAEFFARSTLGEYSAIFREYGEGLYANFKPMSSPYFLVWHFFSGWRLKKEVGKKFTAGRLPDSSKGGEADGLA